jgi:hypothetical protein
MHSHTDLQSQRAHPHQISSGSTTDYATSSPAYSRITFSSISAIPSWPPPDLHRPLLAQQQPAQLGPVGLVEPHLAPQGRHPA